jgi:hypothetical protein
VLLYISRQRLTICRKLAASEKSFKLKAARSAVYAVV